MAKRICYTCKTSYSYCPKCGDGSEDTPWMFMFHDENCREIYKILQLFSQGVLSSKEALKRIDACDLSHKESFNLDVLKDLEKLLAKRPVSKKKIVNKKIENS